eukprot:6691763-Prorocentrum_lima.AAC.1
MAQANGCNHILAVYATSLTSHTRLTNHVNPGCGARHRAELTHRITACSSPHFSTAALMLDL